MFTRSALVLAFLASMVLAGLASIGSQMADPGLAGALPAVLLWMAVAAASAVRAERVLQLDDMSHAFSFEPADGPVHGLGSAASGRLQTVPPIMLAAPPGLR